MITDNKVGLGTISFENFTFLYKIVFTTHCQEERIVEFVNKGGLIDSFRRENRINKDLTLLKLNYIIRPFLKKMMKKDGKYLINVNKSNNSKDVNSILVAIERGRSSLYADYTITVITALISKIGESISFERIPFSNRFVSAEYFDDILKIPSLATDNYISDDNLCSPEVVY